jgi:fructokinase
MTAYRIGIDLGGTKIEIAAMAPDGTLVGRRRVATPQGYDAAIRTLAELVHHLDQQLVHTPTVGVGIPGAISPATGLVKNANSNALNGHRFDEDLAAAIGRAVRIDNDANCFALSEAADGAAAGARVVFGVIMGTGCGGGIVIDGRIVTGRHRLSGEWGHNPLPWPTAEELPGPLCWCGQHNCLETLISGTALAMDCDGPGARDASRIPARAAAGDPAAIAALARHADRTARGLAQIINFLDPDAIVLGGGLSNLDHLYDVLPRLIPRHVFSDVCSTPILRPLHGDSSGVRGAAWLWPPPG